MGRPSNPDRPQTLRQAKRAFRKSSAKPKLSAQELAYAERRTVLQERADKIREKEARKKVNAKKREEKKEKDRETCLRMGREPPREGGVMITSSQPDLSRFLPASELKYTKSTVSKAIPKSPETPIPSDQNKAEQPSELTSPCTVVGPPCDQELMPPPQRSPLRTISENTYRKPIFPASAAKAQAKVQDELADIFVSNTQIERELSPPRPSQDSVHPVISEKPGKSLHNQKEEDPLQWLTSICTQDLDYNLTQAYPVDTQPTAFPHASLSITTSVTTSTSLEPSTTHAPVALGASQNSSHELDLGRLSQSCQNDQKQAQKPTGPRSNTSSFEYSLDFTDQELNVLADEVEVNSYRPKTTTTKTATPPKVQSVPILPPHTAHTTPVTPANKPPICSCRNPECIYPRYSMEHGLTDKIPRLPSGESIFADAWEDDECWDEELCSSVSQEARERVQLQEVGGAERLGGLQGLRGSIGSEGSGGSGRLRRSVGSAGSGGGLKG